MLRLQSDMTQEQMAEALGISLDRYRKYENRTPLPLYLVEPFSIITNYSIMFVVTGTLAPEDTPLSDALQDKLLETFRAAEKDVETRRTLEALGRIAQERKQRLDRKVKAKLKRRPGPSKPPEG